MTRSFFREARLCIVWGGGGSLDLSSPMCFKHSVASKVGPDFLYCSKISHPPKVIADQKTTEFFADFTQEEERILKAGNICAPIESMDIPEMDYELGLVVGIAGGVLLETLQHIVDVARYVVVDVQALTRTIDSETGLIGLQNLEDTIFYDMLEDIHFLKAARNEALFIDIENYLKLEFPFLQPVNLSQRMRHVTKFSLKKNPYYIRTALSGS
uniref:Uncharacterized protein n=1 Tax=Physcomitrium patens TaxID=3218 RepID=A0A7I4AA29_PHYPA